MTDELAGRDPWQALRRFTTARIALGRSGNSLLTRDLLAFQLDHARARDAVHAPFDAVGLAKEIEANGFEALCVDSAALNREVYLRRPDLGRRLSESSRRKLEAWAASRPETFDAAFVLADGLSALAAHRHAPQLLKVAAAKLLALGWRLAPVVIANGGRVAIGDEIGHILRAEQVAVLIGERPGLRAADSLGVYLTYGPHPGRANSERNCISNVRPEGMTREAAADTLQYLMAQAKRRKLTGVALKDDRSDAAGATISESPS